jgi:hypothetical protein
MIFENVFSQRNAAPCKALTYDRIPKECRMQVKHIISDFFSSDHMRGPSEAHLWPVVHKELKKLHGTDNLYREKLYNAMRGYISSSAEVLGYLEIQNDFNKTMDIIEVVFRMITIAPDLMKELGYLEDVNPQLVIDDLNNSFKRYCLGYKFEGGMLIRIDSELIYTDVTKKVIPLLSNPDYSNINQEYMLAHHYYRVGHNSYEDCIQNCNKAVESTMKIICHKKGYTYSQKDSTRELVNILFKNNFVPTELHQYFTGIRKTLEEGVNVIRNAAGGHGKGTKKISITENYVSYTLNITGASIKLLLGILEERSI